ncbi:DUF2341 domain-containing protein [Solimonas flava]|uniref:DUF2341 domain-containing protein n=1 Tax=Solimonas flava TaxID=415849 RepID=UPI0003F7A8D5|nr:MotA/TolQ/ExbB proton channel family protein [Solimonas flava]
MKARTISTALRVALLLACGALLAPTASWAWWNQDWSFRKEIVVDPSAEGAEVQASENGIPVLIRLHEGVFRFEDAAPGGADLRFIAEDDKTPLKYHIEKFDAVFNLAFVWVQLPQLKAGAPTRLWMYYGNAKASDGSDARASYDPDQVLVYHFAERGTPAQDATGYANHSASIATPDDAALIGTGARFDGRASVALPASAALAFAGGGHLTWSAWVNPASANSDGVIYARRDGAAAFVVGLSGGAPYLLISDVAGGARQTPATQPLTAKSWHHLAVVAGGDRATLYVDGRAGPELAASLPALGGSATLGGDAQNAAAGFIGSIDELGIARVARDAGWLRIAALNQGPNDSLLRYGADEQLSSWGSGYVGVILRSVTVDGWVIIALLGVMALISWIVMVRKTRQVHAAVRANRSFLELFRAVASDFSALSHQLAGGMSVGGELDDARRRVILQAPLFRMFNTGVTELRQRLAGDNSSDGRKSAYLSAQSIEAIRAELDQSLVQETQQLNRSMVLLTIAISGGPFLGLLGTVIGVMITFAAIAMAGDVNVNSIAPGIAAALVATVAGLAVAIPALFGYNYLLTRIKDTTAQMQVFVDAFITRMAESYKEPRARRALAAED